MSIYNLESDLKCLKSFKSKCLMCVMMRASDAKVSSAFKLKTKLMFAFDVGVVWLLLIQCTYNRNVWRWRWWWSIRLRIAMKLMRFKCKSLSPTWEQRVVNYYIYTQASHLYMYAFKPIYMKMVLSESEHRMCMLCLCAWYHRNS